MPTFLSRYATPFTTGLFLVSLVSGVALFFHFGQAAFHGMHEWLSMVLIVPFALHLWKNWRPFTAYLKRAPMAVAIVLSLVGGLVFAVPAMTATGGGGPPQRAVFEAVANGSVAEVAPLFGHDGASLAAALTGAGLLVAGPEATIAEVGSASGKDVFAVLGQIVALKKP